MGNMLSDVKLQDELPEALHVSLGVALGHHVMYQQPDNRRVQHLYIANDGSLCLYRTRFRYFANLVCSSVD